MKDEKKAPKLRFKGFTDDWEQCKLGDVASFTNGRAYKQDELLDKGKYRVLRVGNLYTNDSWYYSNMELDDKYYINKGDLIYTWSATFGPHIWDGERAIYHYHIWKVELSDYLDKKFATQLLEIDKTKLLSNTNGSTMVHITKNGMENKQVILPSITEQSCIGKLLRNLDQTITLHEEKKHQLERLKSALLQKMFADKSGYPAVRFKGFDDEWKQFMLGDVAKITMGQSPNSKNYTDNPKDRILVQGNADMKDGQVHPKIWTTEITKTANKGDLILSVRAPVGDIGKTSYDVVIGRGVAAIKGNEFIFQLLKRMKAVGYWTKYSTGSTFESINSLEINNAVINLPKEHEQNEVGNILSYMDHAITLQNYKIELIKKLKSSFLQKMFI